MKITSLHVTLAAFVFLAIGSLTVGCNKSYPYTLRVVGIGDNELTVSDQTGTDQHTHDVAPDATITLDGETIELQQLEPGDNVNLTVESHDGKYVATEIKATSQPTSAIPPDVPPAHEPTAVEPESQEEQPVPPLGDDLPIHSEVIP
jgi:hypothetical protein